MKRYPEQSDFDISQIGYGVAHGSMGTYTYDGKYFWPDLEYAMPGEVAKWRESLIYQGYEVPKKYVANKIELTKDALLQACGRAMTREGFSHREMESSLFLQITKELGL